MRRNRQHIKGTIESWNGNDVSVSDSEDSPSVDITQESTDDIPVESEVVNVAAEPKVPAVRSPRPLRKRKQTTFYQAS